MTDIKTLNAQAAQEAAKELGFENIKDLEAEVNKGLNSSSGSDIRNAKALARKTVEQLISLVLYQEIETSKLGNFAFANSFEDGWITEGNAKQYVVNNPTGHDTYKKEMFIPSEFTQHDVEEYLIQMYDSRGQLNTAQAYQFRKEETYMEAQWIPHFKNGTLSAFVSQIRNNIRKVYDAYKYHNLMTFITQTMVAKVNAKPNTIAGKALNIFEAMANEVLPIIRRLTTQTSKYNYSENSKFINVVDPSNLVVLMNLNNKERLSSGVESQLFHPELLRLNKIIKDENMPELGWKYNITSENGMNTAITLMDVDYIPEDTIIIFDKTMMKHLYQLDKVAVQDFAANLSTTVQYHVWGARDYLPWGVFVVYKNANLTKIPGREELEQAALSKKLSK